MAGEFSYESYAGLLETVIEAGYEFLTVREYLRREDLPEQFVVMRHDVDRKPENARDLARIEAEAGLASTYYFRAVDSTYEPDLFRAVEDLGHEVGYHYEDVDRTDGDLAAAHEAFAPNLARFREHVSVDTVSMHGNPLSAHDNRAMWTDADDSLPTFADYDLVGEVYLSVDFTDVTYFTDTNRTWYDEKTTVNDRPVGDNGKSLQVDTTGDLIDLVAARELDRLYLLAHPDRWTNSYPELAFEVAKDATFNAGKWGLWHLRRLGGATQSGAEAAAMGSRSGEQTGDSGASAGESAQPSDAESGVGG